MAGKRQGKSGSASLLAAALVVGLGVVPASADLTIDVRAQAVSGGGTVLNGKAVVNVAQSSTVTMQVWAQVTGSAGNNTPDIAQCVQYVYGSFLSGNGGLSG